MNPVICFGEALIDFLMINVTPQEELHLPEFRQYPGGAPANAAVAVAKLGGNAKFAGQVGDDTFGQFLADSLQAYGVDTQFLERHPQAKTALAFVSLDHTGERSFSFYRDASADVIFNKDQILPSWFDNNAMIHFCSNTLTTDDIADCTKHLIAQAQQHQSFISFDVNLRHNLWPTGKADQQRVNDLVFQSHLVKFAKEEFDYLVDGQPESYLEHCFNEHCQAIVITNGDELMHYHTANFSGTLLPPRVTAIDTTAGGDAFVGGLLRLLSCTDSPSDAFASAANLEPILQFASYCGAHAVTGKGAFPALPSLDAVAALYADNQLDINAVEQLLNRRKN